MLQTNLFGITADDSLKELRRRYYDLALLCHPDRGGSKEDMLVVQRTYEALKAAMEHQAEGECKREYLETKLRELEQEQTTTTEIPCVRAIFDEVHDHFNQRFNDAFDAQMATIPDTTEPLDFIDPYVEQGYGDYMIIREPSTSTFTVDQLTYNPDDMKEAFDTNSPSLNIIPLESESASRDTTPLSTPISSIVPYSHQMAGEPWARDAHSTTWTRTTRITDFGTSTSVPQDIPLTDYGLSFKPSTCGKFKSWSNSYLPNVREETWEDIYAEMNDESLTTNNEDSTAKNTEHLYYEPCAPITTSTLRRRRGGKSRSTTSKWIIECEPYAYNIMPSPADKSSLSDVVADSHKEEEEDPLYFHQKLLNWLWSPFVDPPNELMDETDTRESGLVHASSNMSSEKLKNA